MIIDGTLTDKERLEECGRICRKYSNCVGFAYVLSTRRCVPKHKLKTKPWMSNPGVTMGEFNQIPCENGTFAEMLD